MIRINHLRLERQHGSGSLVNIHRVRQIHAHKCYINVFQCLNLRNAGGIAAKKNRFASEFQHVAIAAAFGVAGFGRFGEVVHRDGGDADAELFGGGAVGEDGGFGFQCVGHFIGDGLRGHDHGVRQVEGVEGGRVEVVAVDVGDHDQVGFGDAYEGFGGLVGVGVDGFAVPGERQRGVVERLDFERTFGSRDFIGFEKLRPPKRGREQKQKGESRFHDLLVFIQIKFRLCWPRSKFSDDFSWLFNREVEDVISLQDDRSPLSIMTHSLTNALRAAQLSLVLLCAGPALAQEFVVAPFNFNVQNGSYTPASTNAQALAATTREIAPQTFLQKPDPNMSLLFPQPGGVLLFRSKNLKDPANVAGKLIAPSLAIVDTIFHNQVYHQKSGGADKYSFDMCYSLRIDGQRYYTDFRPHTFIDFRYPMVYHKQLFMIAAQDMGYEVYADKGYPEHFHIAIFDMHNGGIEMHFVSEELPFHFGLEFLDQSDNIIQSEYKAEDQSFYIEIKGLNETYKGVWNGKELTHLN